MKRCCWLLVLTMLLVCLLTGCAEEVDGFGSELLHAPVISPEQQEIQRTIRDYLGENITLKYPMSETPSSPFFWWDADGDGTQELVVLYQNTAKSKNVQLAVLCQEEDGWYAAHLDVEGAAGDVDGLRSVRLEDGREYLLAAYQDSTGVDWTVCLYAWRNGALRECARQVCQQYVTADPEGAGCDQLMLVQYNEIYGNLQLRVYGAPQENSAGTALTERSVTILDSRFERCHFMQLSALESGGVSLVMDFTDGSGSSLGEVLNYQNGRFIRCYTTDGSNIPNFTARPFSGLLPADQDGDGGLELPRVETQVFGSGTPVRFYFVSWYRISVGETQLRDYTLVDTQERYVLRLPAAWRGQVMLQADGGGVWSLRFIENGARRAWFCLTEEKPDNDYLIVSSIGDQQFCLQFAEQMELDDRVILLGGLRLLYE